MTEPAATLPDGRLIARPAFLLDFDGTLIDIAPTPDSVILPPTLPALLHDLRARHGDALAIVTGRPIEAIDRYLGGAPFAVAGEHGTALRLMPGHPVEHPPLPELPVGAFVAAQAAAARFPGTLVERKGHGVTLHYRQAPAAEAALRAEAEAIVAACPGFALLDGKMIWEIRPQGVDKGSAVRTIMATLTFAGRTPIFIGDDATDEDGIAAATALGGTGLRVADVFGNPDRVRAWLETA